MKPKRIEIIWFSPVYHTRQLALALGESFGDFPTRHHDITVKATVGLQLGAEDLAIIAIPVYAGRVPPLAASRISQIQAKGTPAVLLASYGNRAYDDALADLKQIAVASGFLPLAAAACVARHTIGLIFGEGRPNATDLAELDAFGKKLLQKLSETDQLTQVSVPGATPGDGAKVFPLPQKVNENCVNCGHCWEMCPAGAITPHQPARVDTKLCICCMRCVAICPESARIPDPAFINGIRQKLTPLCADPKRNEFFGG